MRYTHIGLTESADTKRKKSIPIIAINENIIVYSDSAKLLADQFNKDRSTVTASIKNGRNISGYYIFYQDVVKRELIFNNLKGKNEIYSKYYRVLEKDVETIESEYNIKYLTYS